MKLQFTSINILMLAKNNLKNCVFEILRKVFWHPTKYLMTCLLDHLTYSLIAISFVRRQSLSNKYIKGPALFSLSVLSSL